MHWIKTHLQVLLGVLLAGVTLAIYWPVWHQDFILYDDPKFVRYNPYAQYGLNWETFVWVLKNPVAGNWHPVTTITHALDCDLFGKDAGPHHFVNVLIHGATAVLLFLLLKRMTGSLWRSVLVAAIFAWHPLRVESVAWVAERKDVLSGLFMMLALGGYIGHVQRLKTGSPGSENHRSHFSTAYVLSVLFFALGLMSKPMLVTLPFVLLLLDYWPLQRFEASSSSKTENSGVKILVALIREKLPFFVLSAVFCLITLLVQKSEGLVLTTGKLAFGDRVSNAIVSYVRYLEKMVWPTNLAIIYPHPAIRNSNHLSAWHIAAAAAVLVMITAWCLWQRRRRPYLIIGWLWFLGTLVPVIGLVQVGEQAIADRYTYIPLVGPVLSLVWFVADSIKFGRWGKWWIGTASLLLLTTLVALTHRQLNHWKNTITLFEHTLKVTSANPTAHFVLGCAFEAQGNPVQAMVHYRAAVAIDPLEISAHYNMAQLLRREEKWEPAAEHYEVVIRLAPRTYFARLNLAEALLHLDRPREAMVHMDEALALNPNSPPELLNDLAWALATSPSIEKRDGAHAVQFAEQACQLTGSTQTVFIGTLAAAYAEAGRFGDAIEAANRACSLAAASGEQTLLEKNQQLRKLYQSGQPYHEPAK